MAESFTVLERITLMRLLQQARGSMETMRAVDKFSKELEFGKKEQEALKDKSFGLTDPGPATDIECSPLVKVAVQNILKEMDKASTLERVHLPIWERFIDGKMPAPVEASAPSPDGALTPPTAPSGAEEPVPVA